MPLALWRWSWFGLPTAGCSAGAAAPSVPTAGPSLQVVACPKSKRYLQTRLSLGPGLAWSEGRRYCLQDAQGPSCGRLDRRLVSPSESPMPIAVSLDWAIGWAGRLVLEWFAVAPGRPPPRSGRALRCAWGRPRVGNSPAAGDDALQAACHCLSVRGAAVAISRSAPKQSRSWPAAEGVARSGSSGPASSSSSGARDRRLPRAAGAPLAMTGKPPAGCQRDLL